MWAKQVSNNPWIYFVSTRYISVQMCSMSHLLFLVQGHLCCYLYLEVITLSTVSTRSFVKKRTLRVIRAFQAQLDRSLSMDSGFWPNDKDLLSLFIEWQLSSPLQHIVVFVLIYCNCQESPKLSSFSQYF